MFRLNAGIRAIPHAAVLLAAGGSLRLGLPKQLLTIGGESLLRRAARLAGSTQPETLVVVLGAHCERMREELAGLDLQIVVNLDWAQGMAGSLRVAAPWVVDFEHVLVMGCDQPALTAAHLVKLLASAGDATSGCAASLCGGMRGIPAVVGGVWFAGGEALPQPDAGFRSRLRALPALDVHLVDAPALCIDIDTPEQLARARAKGLVDP